MAPGSARITRLGHVLTFTVALSATLLGAGLITSGPASAAPTPSPSAVASQSTSPALPSLAPSVSPSSAGPAPSIATAVPHDVNPPRAGRTPVPHMPYIAGEAGPGTRSQIINVAQAELANTVRNHEVGGCNWYAGYYHSQTTGCPVGWGLTDWCAFFARYVWQTAGIPTTGIDGFAGSFYQYYGTAANRHPVGSGYVPVPGDAVVFDYDGNRGTGAHYGIDHVALVVAVSSTGFTVIEGNSDDRTEMNNCSRTYSAIVGYVNPITPGGIGDPGPITHVRGDYNGDGKSDRAVYRPSTQTFFLNGAPGIQWGDAGDVPLQGDFTGDGIADMALFRPSTADWFVRNISSVRYGDPGDVPLPYDYNGDGITDRGVYRPSIMTFYMNYGPGIQFGNPGDVPFVGDFDGDGVVDVAVYRSATRQFLVRNIVSMTYGNVGDVPVPADYDGDGKTDIAVFRPSTHTFYVGTAPGVSVGQVGDLPVKGDFDGDGKIDLATFHQFTAAWYVKDHPVFWYGTTGDRPLF